MYTGGYGGSQFEHQHFDGPTGVDPGLTSASESSPFLSKIEVWEKPKSSKHPDGCMQGLKLSWDDGKNSGVIGTIRGAKYFSFDFQKGEHLTSLSVAAVSGNTRTGYIDLMTNKGRVFKHGSTGSTHLNKIPLSSGFLMGVYGRCHDDVDSLGFYFLQNVTRVEIDITYDALPESNSIFPVSHNIIDGDNTESDQPLNIQIAQTESVTNSIATTEGWTETAGITATTSLGFLGLASASVGASFTESHQKITSTTHSEMRAIIWTSGIAVPAHQRYSIELLYYKATFQITYKAKATFYCKDGTKRTHIWPGNTSGMVSGVGKIISKRLGYEDEVEVEVENK